MSTFLGFGDEGAVHRKKETEVSSLDDLLHHLVITRTFDTEAIRTIRSLTMGEVGACYNDDFLLAVREDVPKHLAIAVMLKERESA